MWTVKAEEVTFYIERSFLFYDRFFVMIRMRVFLTKQHQPFYYSMELEA